MEEETYKCECSVEHLYERHSSGKYVKICECGRPLWIPKAK